MQHFKAIGESKLELQSGNAQSGSNLSIFRAVWPWNLTDDLQKHETLQSPHNERAGVPNHRRIDCLPNRLCRCRTKKTWKLCVTGHCEGNSSVTGEFPAQTASNAEHYSIWWCHHEIKTLLSALRGIHWLHIKTSNAETVSFVMISLCIGACHWSFQFQHHEEVVKRNKDEIVQEAREGRRQSARR